MELSLIMELLSIVGLALGLLMKYNKIFREFLKLNHPRANTRYMNYKINFLIVMAAVLLIVELLGSYNQGLSEKLDIIISAILLTSITVDMIIRKRMKNSQK